MSGRRSRASAGWEGRRRGSASLFSLFISMVILTVAIGFNWLVREQYRASVALEEKVEAFVLGQSTFNLLLFSISCGRVGIRDAVLYRGKELLNLERMPIDGTELVMNSTLHPGRTYRIRISVQDTNGLLSLTNLYVPGLKNLLEFFGVENERKEIIIDSLLDWIDEDDLERLYGAEESYYRRAGKPYGPRNYPLQYKEELLFIRGMDEVLYQKISPFLTILPNTGFNPNTAPVEVLRAYLDIRDEMALKNLKQFLANNTLLSERTLFELTARKLPDMEAFFFSPSYYFDVRVRVGREEPVYHLESGIRLFYSVDKPFEILYWRDR